MFRRYRDLFGVRVDTGVQDGGEIPMFYDSMIAKLIVHGKDRHDAIAKMREALNGFVIRGICSNIPFQAALLAHPKFVAGDFNTGFIAEHYAKGFRAEDVPHDDTDFLVAMAAFVNAARNARPASPVNCRATVSTWAKTTSWSCWLPKATQAQPVTWTSSSVSGSSAVETGASAMRSAALHVAPRGHRIRAR